MQVNENSQLSKKLEILPDLPGVYLMQDIDGAVIYIGKAKNLKNRVRQYFRSGDKSAKLAAMTAKICDFYYIITGSETQALALENNLIKKHKPRYNILLKDDKTFPYLKINLKEKYPYFVITRRLNKDGSKYFGPFMAGMPIKEILNLIELAFNLRSCKTLGKKECLNFHIGKCPAPCTQKISRENYLQNVQRAIDFLNGQDDSIEKVLTNKMIEFSEKEQFELALMYRDRLRILTKLQERKITALNNFLNADVIALENNGIHMAFNVLIIRGGRMQGGKNFSMQSVYENDNEALTAFIAQYYLKNELPSEIITHKFAETTLIESYLSSTYSRKTALKTAVRGIRAQLFEMSLKNAKEYLDKQIDKIKHKEDMTKLACLRLQEILSLKKYPRRMECFDISNISGVDKVGSMVVFIDGEPDKNSYRRFKIRTVEGADDFASLKEVLKRRLFKLEDNTDITQKSDLIVIDGGKGQLSTINSLLQEIGCDIELIAFSENNEIFTTSSKTPLNLSKSDYALRLLQRIRDEAHRFAINYHRSLRSKRTLSSTLDNISGIGKARRKALLEKFKSIDNILSASEIELAQVPNISSALAKRIKSYFDKEIKNQ